MLPEAPPDVPNAPPSPWAPPPSAKPAPKASINLLLSVTLISLVADLASKSWAKAALAPIGRGKGKHFTVIAGYVDFIFAQNPGGAWSFLRSVPDTIRRPFFLMVSSAAIVFIVSVYRRLSADQRAMKWGLAFALGGAMGNLVDRIRFGWVVDFVDVYITRGGKEHHWPTFNVADIAIVIGVLLMASDMLRPSRRFHAIALAGPSSSSSPVPPPSLPG